MTTSIYIVNVKLECKQILYFLMVIPEDCNALVIWNKFVELQMFFSSSDLLLCISLCPTIFNYQFYIIMLLLLLIIIIILIIDI
jgi:hypothetical protein